jgi:hypothetical protein
MNTFQLRRILYARNFHTWKNVIHLLKPSGNFT